MKRILIFFGVVVFSVIGGCGPRGPRGEQGPPGSGSGSTNIMPLGTCSWTIDQTGNFFSLFITDTSTSPISTLMFNYIVLLSGPNQSSPTLDQSISPANTYVYTGNIALGATVEVITAQQFGGNGGVCGYFIAYVTATNTYGGVWNTTCTVNAQSC